MVTKVDFGFDYGEPLVEPVGDSDSFSPSARRGGRKFSAAVLDNLREVLGLDAAGLERLEREKGDWTIPLEEAATRTDLRPEQRRAQGLEPLRIFSVDPSTSKVS